MNKKNILVFPCGSEIGLEIHRALRYSAHVNLIGASSIDDHGKFVYEMYVGGLPFVSDPAFVSALQKIIAEYRIDAIYPTMDEVIYEVRKSEAQLPCKVIASPLETTLTCRSKSATYEVLRGVVKTPHVYDSAESVHTYPVFVKPDKGYGSRGAAQISSRAALDVHLKENPGAIIMEYLPGPEYTVDCFSNSNGELLFAGSRQRKRIMNGISVNSSSMQSSVLNEFATRINSRLDLRGAWFFQVKENAHREPVLLEVASRLGGTSSVYRVQGVNFALLSVFDVFDLSVTVLPNTFDVEVDRSLDNRYKLNLEFDTVYLDLDDTLIHNGTLNVELMALVFQFIRDRKKVILITKHESDVAETLTRFRMAGLFDEIIHLKKADDKASRMKDPRAILIDDSFAERKAVMEKLHIPVFAPDAAVALLNL